MAFPCKTLYPFLTLTSYILCIILHMHSQMTYSLSDGDTLLKFKSSLANSDALTSWDPNTAPCHDKSTRWNGIVCFEGIVTGIHLKSMGLSGNIDMAVLTNLPGLRAISLEDNKFSGTIPEFNRLGALKAVYLTKNEFSGVIAPDYFSKMGSLKKLWLSNNKFTGEIPSSLVNLKYLIELHLENNQFSGLVPKFMQPPLVSLDVSNNQLTGEIPTSLSFCKPSSFEGNANLCGQIVGKDCSLVTTNKGSNPSTNDIISEANKKHKSNVAATGITIGVVMLSLVIIVGCVAKRRKDNVQDIPTAYNNRPPKGPENAKLASKANKISEGVVEVVEVAPALSRKGSSQSSKRSNSSRRGSTKGGSGVGDLTMVNEEKGVFGLGDLMKASAEVLGNGGMGSAYKAVMANGLSVAVKRMRELNKLESDGFDVEMRKLAGLRHKNILPPLAYHYRKGEKLVVYEYVAKGSLHFLLHGERGSSHAELNWPTRLKIIKGTIEGLNYLHSQLSSCELPHGNLKSSNVLINLQNEALLSDYGFITMTNPNNLSTALFAYKSPEAVQSQTVSHKSDIYCLVVVILEILTRKFPSQYVSATNKGGTDVVQWVASAIAEGREGELLDSNIVSKSPNCKDDMVEMLHVGANCTVSNPDSRPSLKEVMERVNRVYSQDGVQDDRTIEVSG